MSNSITNITESSDLAIPSDFIGGNTVSPAMMILLNDKLFDRAKLIASYLAKADGFTPAHLIGKTEACFAVVVNALTWKLNPFAVAQSTYSPSAGKVGYEGKLCQAIIENSGKVKGGVTFEPYGDWSKVQGKFTIKTSDKGKKYPCATYNDSDEAGLGLIARAQVEGEATPREYRIDLRQAWPRNSTLWATDPLTQLKYRAARGLGNIAMPGIFMGVPFERDDFDSGNYGPDNAKDITPAKEVMNSIAEQIEEAKKTPITDTEIAAESDSKASEAATDAEFDINLFNLNTQAGIKEATKALCAQLSGAPEDERGSMFLMNSGRDIVAAMSRAGLGMLRDKFTALGINLGQE